jgi:glycosyltransferase involved in cell wall biosynthesis
VPVVITVHGADVYQHLRMDGAVERRVRQALGGADAVMANSSVVARLLRDVVAPEKLTVVLNGTTGLATQVEPASDYLTGEPLVLTVGRLIERKGTADLIAAIGTLRRAGRRIQLAIVGDGPLRHTLEEQATAEGVADDVHFVGRLEHARVLAMMARAQLFALPSWDEAFGLVYTEAMAQGTPVLALQGGGPEDFVDNGVSGGWLVPVRDPGAIAEVIAWVLDDPDGAAAIGAAGRATALGLSWQRNARLTLEVYERVLKHR